jgi:hypothetical protein
VNLKSLKFKGKEERSDKEKRKGERSEKEKEKEERPEKENGVILSVISSNSKLKAKN